MTVFTEVTPLANELYAAVQPLAYGDSPLNGYALLIYCNALIAAAQVVATQCEDTSTRPGWAILMDPDTCPPNALPWLAQFGGINITYENPLPGETEAAFILRMREKIKMHAGTKRCTREAIIAAAQAHLTGEKRVVIVERDGQPARYSVITFGSETPSEAVVREALEREKPSGFILNYQMVTHHTWLLVKAEHATWAAVKTAYPTWHAVL